MITPTKAYKASDGTLHATPEAAQEAELHAILAGAANQIVTTQDINGPAASNIIMGVVMKNRDAILDILTTGPRSRPARRKVNGAVAPKRKAKAVAATPEQAQAGFAGMRAATEAA